MMKVMFTRWMIDHKGRKPIAVDPSRVDAVEHSGDAYGNKGDASVRLWWNEDVREAPVYDQIPACTKIIMQGKQEYLVQGTVEDVAYKINKAIQEAKETV
jgi:hypothetical protein